MERDKLTTYRGFDYRTARCFRSSALTYKRPFCWALRCLSIPLLIMPGLGTVKIKRRAVDRLRNISSQEALILLRALFSLLASVTVLSVQGPPSVRAVQLKSAVSYVLIQNLANAQWLQAFLPLRVASLALPAFLATVANTLCLLADCSSCSPDCCSSLQAYLSDWSARFGTS